MRNLIGVALIIASLTLGDNLLAIQEKKNRVVVMGMVHAKHETEADYSLDKVKQIIRTIKPDVVLTEIPPDRLDKAVRQFKSTGKITEPRVARFPEYTNALFPLTREMDLEIVPCAAWTKSMNDERREIMNRLKVSHADQYSEMQAAQKNMDLEIAKFGRVYDPVTIHTERYDQQVRRGMEPYDRYFNDLIGKGGWTNINRAHYALIEQALDSYSGQGKTVLITFGAWHKYFIKDQLRLRQDIEIVSLQKFLPSGNVKQKGTVKPVSDWPRFRRTSANQGSAGHTEIAKPELIWKYDTGDIIESSPSVVSGKVLIGGHSKNLVALDRNSGKKIWTFETAGWVRASPSVVDGIAYFGSDDNTFYAIDIGSGAKRWEFELGQGGEQSSPAVDDGVVYFGAFDHHVYALDCKSGAQKWKFDAGASMLSSPALSKTAVFIATYDGKLFAISRDAGKLLWQFHHNDKPIFSSPAYVDGKLFFSSYDHHVYCVDAKDGKEIWRFKTGNEIFSSPAWRDAIVYVGSNDNHLYALDARSGKQKWKSDLNGPVFASPAVTTDSVYVGSSDGFLYCLDRADGQQRWRYLVKKDAKVWSSVAAIDGRVYCGSHAGSLIVLGESQASDEK